ncbi:AAA ATPase central domain protein [Rhizobium sp. CF080]|uniref:AAA family ATPase n=1 Tax=Rhizobium sp. (strain CF080) TaxID=1144310 RepID=UPI0003E7D85A|nr:AAA family ATPase [Rhizobium sp. CF080]EUB97526.1 AAA ATPase central domain protein [Rhizobium sp. CF080]
MSYRSASPRNSPPSLAVAVARCGVRNALRPFLRRPDICYVAVLLVPEGTADYYSRAVSSLIRDPVPIDEDCNETAVVMTLSDQTIEPRTLCDRLRHGRQVVVVTEKADRLPPEFLAGADLVRNVVRPTLQHLMAASRTAKVPGMTHEFAEFLSTQSFDIIAAVIRPTRPLLNSVRQLRRMAEKRVEPPAPVDKPSALRLEETHGYGEARDWGLRLAEDIASWKRGEIAWEDVDRGALLCGPPGCGKTTYAKALAASCGVELVVASAGRWQAAGHLGDYLKAMRASFKQAQTKAPSILFLDEFDSFGSREVAVNSDNQDYKRQAVNALLECLDPSEGREGVVVIGATNDASGIDPALMRPGRLEIRIDIPLPDSVSRVGILRQHLSGHVVDGALARFARATRGWSGADIEKLARDVRRLARRRCVPVSEALVMEALPARRFLSDDELRRVAVHEAGHAVVGTLLFPDSLLHVYVERDVPANSVSRVVGAAVFQHATETVNTPAYYDNRIAMMLGGIAAEELVFGDRSDGAGGDPLSDLGVASDVATRMERCLGLGEALSVEFGNGSRPLEYLRERDPELRRLVEVRLKAQFDRAVGMLDGRRTDLDGLVEILVTRGRATGDEVREMLSDASEDTASVAP